jgi:hypothetical protein
MRPKCKLQPRITLFYFSNQPLASLFATNPCNNFTIFEFGGSTTDGFSGFADFRGDFFGCYKWVVGNRV